MRVAQLQKRLRDDGIDCCVLLDNDTSVFYFSGIELEKCTLVIPAKSDPYFILSDLEEQRTKQFSRVKKIFSFSTKSQRDSLVAIALKNCRLVAINKESIAVKSFEFLSGFDDKIAFTDCSDIIAELRMVKTKYEIELLRKACALTDKILAKCIESFEFKTELEVKNFLEFEVRKAGAKLSFDTIVASGKNAAMPHYFGNEKLSKGFCVIDFGIRLNGYCSDITRTIFLGNPSNSDMEIYNIVLASQQKGIDAALPNANAGDVDMASRQALGKHSKSFIHGLGHHIGIEVHDAGFRISANSKGILSEGMAITIEPGVYYEGKLGIRIEDDVLIKSSGNELLTKLKKDLVVIPF